MTSAINLLTTIFGSKLGIGTGQPQLTPQQLQGQPALPPGQTFTPQQLQALQPYLQQLQGQQLQTGQTIPQAQPQLAGTPQPQPAAQPQPQPQTPARDDISKSSNEAHRRFYYMFIDPIRRAITGGEPDNDIAKKIIDMMEYSVDYMQNDPHPLVAGMVRNMENAAELNRELYRFFDSIPELAGLKQRQDSIHANIIAIYTGSPDTEITGQPEENLTGSETGQPEPAHQEVVK